MPKPAIGQDSPTNQQVIVNETIRLLESSDLVQDTNAAITLETNSPDDLRQVWINSLLEMGKKIRLDPTQGEKIKIEIHTNNTFTRLNRKRGQRHIKGDLILYLADDLNVIKETESQTFSFMDTISVRDKVAMSQDTWQATHFHDEKDSRRRSIVNKVAEPLIIIGASAVTIFLLYNVRR
ncbi:MAG: hypothetical protein WD267_11290 [Balneolales bacterium]